MSLRIKCETAPTVATGEASYRTQDLALTYSHHPSEAGRSPTLADVIDSRLGIRRESPVLVCADTLVLTFSGEAGELVALDAYTNWKHWRRVGTLELPMLTKTGRVYLAEKCGEDRISVGVVPEYVFLQDPHLLCLRLFRGGREQEFFRVSDCLVVRISGDTLSELWIEKLVIR